MRSQRSPTDGTTVVEQVVVMRLGAWAAATNVVQLAFLTGSFVAVPRPRPEFNLNAYFVCRADSRGELVLALRELCREVAEALDERGIAFAVDVHPYGLSMLPGAFAGGPCLWLTTKAIPSDVPRLGLPPHIGPGWVRNLRVLHGDASLLDAVAAPPKRNVDWLVGLHEALSRYALLVDHLPWMLEAGTHDAVLIRESIRYAEEAAKDCVSLCCNAAELEAGHAFDVLADWRGTGGDFLSERLDPEEATAMFGALGRLQSGADPSREDAEDVWLAAREVIALVWRRYLRVADELGARAVPDMRRLSMFV